MKNYLISAFLIAFTQLDSFGQSNAPLFFFDELSILASDCKIEIIGKDTVLVSEYKNPNIKLQSRNDFARVYKGTPFFNNGWFNGSVSLAGGGVSKGYMAFNLVTNSLFFSIGPDKEAIELRPLEFTINGITFRNYRNQYAGAGILYYQKLVEGELELFKNIICKYVPAMEGDKNGYEQTGDGFEGYFVKETTFFINYQNKMQRVGKKFKIFDKNEGKAKAFAENNNLSLQNPSDLIKIVRHINGLDSNL